MKHHLRIHLKDGTILDDDRVTHTDYWGPNGTKFGFKVDAPYDNSIHVVFLVLDSNLGYAERIEEK